MDWTLVGGEYRNFIVTKSLWIEELQCRLVELEHRPSGAQVMHIVNDDPENLFNLSFQTIPSSSDGVAHILEHTVLCGSKKYPVKDPFFSMTRRSLNTFMNALTGSDFTCYPAATQVKKDFYNLLDVYLDAVFYPNLKKLSFAQEGHRVEFEDGKLEYKGIVFNEMKGAMASPTSRLYDQLYNALFPDITYGWNSGGDPAAIPDLTYEGFLAFHKTYYHPSRCLFFFYGNLPLEGHLDFISQRVLDGASKEAPLKAIPKQPRFQEPKRIVGSFPSAQDEEAKAYITFGWLTCSILEQEKLLALAILESVLMDTDASPLKLALLRSGLCTQAQALIDPDISEVPFAIILKGCNGGDADALEKLLFEVLREIADGGIADELVESAIHQQEFHRSEITGDHSPFGLTLFMRSALLKQHGAAPEEGLQIHALFERLHKRMAEDPSYLSDLLREMLIDNPHFVRLVMIPDPELNVRENREEEERLSRYEAQMSAEQKTAIIAEAEALEQFQLEQEDADHDILPRVTLKDVPKDAVDYGLEKGSIGKMRTYFHDSFTNGIVYANLSWQLPHIAEDRMWLVRLFAALLTQVGAGGRSYNDTLNALQADTGGIGAALGLSVDAVDRKEVMPSFNISGKALYRKGRPFLSLMRDFAADADFTDRERVKEIVMKHYTALHTTLTQNAMKYAFSLSASGLSAASKISNSWYGVDYYQKVKNLADNYEEREKELLDQLQLLQKELLQLDDPALVVTCSRSYYDEIASEGFYGLPGIEYNAFVPWSHNTPLIPVQPQGRMIASPVAFTSRALATVSYVDPVAPAIAAAANLFDNTHLHVALREQGGAYGGGASCHALSGELLFYAYRDPNIVSSLAAFKAAAVKIAMGDFDDRELEEAKLEVIQKLDSPIAPGSRGIAAYSWLQEGRTLPVRQSYRDRLLALTKEEVAETVRERILGSIDEAPTVIFAGKALLESENALLSTKLTLSSV